MLSLCSLFKSLFYTTFSAKSCISEYWKYVNMYWTKGNIIGWPDICRPNRPKIFPFVQYSLIHDLAHKAIKSAINSWKTSNTTSWDLWQEDEKLLATVIIVKSRKVREKKWFVQKNFTPLILMLGSRFIFPMTNLFWNFDFKFGNS